MLGCHHFVPSLATSDAAILQADRETLTQLLFERFQVEGLFLAEQPVLALYSQGRLTGCVVDVGHDKTGHRLVKTVHIAPHYSACSLLGDKVLTDSIDGCMSCMASEVLALSHAWHCMAGWYGQKP